jgi:hypothetical protein
VQEDLAQQLEATVLNTMGAFMGIGISTFAKYIASISTHESFNTRLIPALFLVTISFFGKHLTGSNNPCVDSRASWLDKKSLTAITVINSHIMLCIDMDSHLRYGCKGCTYLLQKLVHR